jgi:spore germination protein YaaH
LFNSSIAILLIILATPVNPGQSKHLKIRTERTAAPSQIRPSQVIGYLAEWDQERGFRTIQDNYHLFTEVSLFWYRINSSGEIVPYNPANVDLSIVSFLHSKGIDVTATIANVNNGEWDSSTVRQIINDRIATTRHIQDIVNLAVSKGYDGIDIDYESLSEEDRDAYSTFIGQLATALHAKGKKLTVPVYAKTSEPGNSSGARAQDWAAIGRAADQVRVMIYDYHWATSQPGPIAPIDWADEVAAYAVSQIPKRKIVLGFGLYGYDWVGERGVDLMWQEVDRIARQHGATVDLDEASQSPWFRYTASNGSRHTVWFENATSTRPKLDIVNRYQVAGVHFWRLGGEDPKTWQVVKSKLLIAREQPIIYLPYVAKQGYNLWPVDDELLVELGVG